MSPEPAALWTERTSNTFVITLQLHACQQCGSHHRIGGDHYPVTKFTPAFMIARTHTLLTEPELFLSSLITVDEYTFFSIHCRIFFFLSIVLMLTRVLNNFLAALFSTNSFWMRSAFNNVDTFTDVTPNHSCVNFWAFLGIIYKSPFPTYVMNTFNLNIWLFNMVDWGLKSSCL